MSVFAIRQFYSYPPVLQNFIQNIMATTKQSDTKYFMVYIGQLSLSIRCYFITRTNTDLLSIQSLATYLGIVFRNLLFIQESVFDGV